MDTVKRIIDLMEKNNVTAAMLTREISLTNGLVYQWKTGKSKPSTEAVIKLAVYFGVTTDYLLLGKDPVITTDLQLTENGKEILELLYRFDERTQLKFLGRVEAIAKEMVDDTAPKTPQSPYNTQGLNRKKELYMDKNYKVLYEGNNGRNKPSTPPPTHSTNKGDKSRNPSSSVPPAKK